MTATSAFRFGGRLSLDLTWTLRYRRIAPAEMLATPGDLRRWVGVAIAPARGPVDADRLTAAIDLREAVFRAASATIDGSRVHRADRAVINGWAEHPGPIRMLDAAGHRAVRLRSDDEIGSALSAIADDAIDVLAGAPGRLRRCEGPDCALLFHDGSRPGLRRWCSVERCGNRVNTTAYRRRNSTTTTEV